MTSTLTRTVRVGILGFGTVGSGAYRMLQDNRDAILRRVGVPFEVTKIGIRDTAKPRQLPAEMFTTDLTSIVDDPAIEVVLELIGGVDPAAELVERALRNGKHVVTANKELIAKHGARLISLAKSKGLDLHYEAAVGGGIPLVQPLKHQLAGNDVLKMMGILNGTTNYILTKMQREGADFADVLAEAQAKGYAEADPTNDVDGFDTMYKISVLASIAFHKHLPVEGVYREGIRGVSLLDMQYADALGYTIKFLAIVDAIAEDTILARVHPTLIPKTHPLASVNDVYNALYLHGDFVGDLMFSGRGAGSDPTASAVVGDLLDVGRNIAGGGSGSAIPFDEEPLKTCPIDDLRTAFYLRLVVQDRPKVLGIIATEFGEHDVSLAAMEMKTLDESRGEIVFLTHPCLEKNFRELLVGLKQSGVVEEVCSSIRVVS
ncbi:homoserine dehydrogenase [Fimbriimonas ginsengisoli]|uniref:Homoserine dehydrogenase n=1 Tax=Fimbriimonas ginsengisoli Gsoil 348 TaxID=661478 RepID=A0A068NXU3_FIMGI|nr:homoserine dehydrogenase [Fimbriimonas ginsengisoli]AIE88182.1 homoserine dehydrogenase [Fimbriimonas ginsengisoli Gsoil 348]